MLGLKCKMWDDTRAKSSTTFIEIAHLNLESWETFCYGRNRFSLCNCSSSTLTACLIIPLEMFTAMPTIRNITIAWSLFTQQCWCTKITPAERPASSKRHKPCGDKGLLTVQIQECFFLIWLWQWVTSVPLLCSQQSSNWCCQIYLCQ